MEILKYAGGGNNTAKGDFLMKKMVVVAMILLVTAAGIHAQQAGQWTIGGRLGAAMGLHNAGDFDESGVSIDPLFNFNFALYANYAFTDRVSFQPEFNFMINQGYQMRIPLVGSMDITYSSLDIPLLLRISLLERPAAMGFLLGPHLSIPLGRGEVSGGGVSAEFDIDTGITFGITAGIFTGWQAGPGRLIADMRFIFDFNGVEDMLMDEFIRRRALITTIGYEVSF